MSFELRILGCHSSTPRTGVHPSSQLLKIKNHHFLIDCGEGTQMQLCEYKVSFAKIQHIFISHLHGDHFFGLFGLLSSFKLLDRRKELHIYAPEGLKKLIELQTEVSDTKFPFSIIFNELKNPKSCLIYEDEKVEIYTIPLKHRLYTNGFLFREKPGLRKLNMEAVKNYPEITTYDYHNIKKGKDFVSKDGSIIQNKLLTLPVSPPLSYAYCSDTSYNPAIVPLIKNVDLLYHESTFLNNKKDLAAKTGHSTAVQAAKIAAEAQVKKLLLGHYSSRYKEISAFLEEARQIFKNTFLTEEGNTIEVG